MKLDEQYSPNISKIVYYGHHCTSSQIQVGEDRTKSIGFKVEVQSNNIQEQQRGIC